ncbi:hypothetical protein C0584_01830 [Candidatus Parcubacteria bacterium]|nr:MAG: hypothetical protein C0584_01830 [Candidatus Parcubacteria bacterium]
MKKLFILLSLLFFLPQLTMADDCRYPRDISNPPDEVVLSTKVLKYEGLFIFLDLYDWVDGSMSENDNNKKWFRVLFANGIGNGWEYLEDLDVDDYWDEQGNTIPYIQIEVGGMNWGGQAQRTGNMANIGTCFDRQKFNFDYLFEPASDEFESIIALVLFELVPRLHTQKALYHRE